MRGFEEFKAGGVHGVLRQQLDRITGPNVHNPCQGTVLSIRTNVRQARASQLCGNGHEAHDGVPGVSVIHPQAVS